ncbi:MAG: hypothetical protein JO339_17860 [Alphaproteobacteria bacterium]|nr:hypothetical protein [Alphaproteobacteria bacterium]
MQLAEDLQRPADLGGLGEQPGLGVAFVGGGDDGDRADLAVLSVDMTRWPSAFRFSSLSALGVCVISKILR